MSKWVMAGVAAILTIAGLALVLPGCIELTADPGSRLLYGLYTGYAVLCEQRNTGTPFANNEIQVYSINPDGSLNPISSPANGEDCDPSNNDDGRASTMSPPYNPATSGQSNAVGMAPRAAGGPQLQAGYPALLPLPFPPPSRGRAFPHRRRRRAPPIRASTWSITFPVR